MLALGLLFGHLAVTQSDFGFAVGAGASGIAALWFVVAAVRA